MKMASLLAKNQAYVGCCAFLSLCLMIISEAVPGLSFPGSAVIPKLTCFVEESNI